MKFIYTNENRLLVSNFQNILLNEGIAITLKNEYAAGASGDIPFLNTWPEIWVVNDEDYAQALEIISKTLNQNNTDYWVCTQCGEQNTSAFEVCWNCQNENVP